MANETRDEFVDRHHAMLIRDGVKALRLAIINAEKDGLTVDVPELVYLYLAGGTASGAPDDWKIYRKH
jgi:hypothetical protein